MGDMSARDAEHTAAGAAIERIRKRLNGARAGCGASAPKRGIRDRASVAAGRPGGRKKPADGDAPKKRTWRGRLRRA